VLYAAEAEKQHTELQNKNNPLVWQWGKFDKIPIFTLGVFTRKT
jgi:hypothetical protein